MHHVHVIFTGIIALISSAPQNGSMTAVVLNAATASVAADGTAIPPHVGWIMVEQAKLAEGSAAPDRVVTHDGVPTAVYILRGEEIRLNAAPADDLVLVDGLPSSGETASAANRSFLHWAARTREIWPGDHALNSAYLDADPDPQLVSARMQLSGGALSTDYVGERVWEFRPGPRNRVRHALAQQIAYDLNAAGAIEITLRTFRSNAARVIRLKDGDAQLLVGNTPENEIESTAMHVHETVDHHFELYYRLFAAPPAEKPIPYLIENGNRRPGGPRFVPTPNFIMGGNCPPLLID